MRVMLFRGREEGDTCGGDNEWRGNVVSGDVGAHREANQVWKILVLVFLVAGGGGVGSSGG